MTKAELRIESFRKISNVSDSTPIKQVNLEKCLKELFKHYKKGEALLLDLTAFRGSNRLLNGQVVNGSTFIIDDIASQLDIPHKILAYEAVPEHYAALVGEVSTRHKQDIIYTRNLFNSAALHELQVNSARFPHLFAYMDCGGDTDWDVLRSISKLGNVDILLNLNVSIQKRLVGRGRIGHHRLSEDIASLHTKHNYISYILRNKPSWSFLYFSNKIIRKNQLQELNTHNLLHKLGTPKATEYLKFASFTKEERTKL